MRKIISFPITKKSGRVLTIFATLVITSLLIFSNARTPALAATYPDFGDGSDGDLVVSSGQKIYVDNLRSALSNNAPAGQRTLPLVNTAGFFADQEVFIIQMMGTGAGYYEYGVIDSVNIGYVTLTQNLEKSYTVGGKSKAQIVRIPHYHNVIVQGGGLLTAHPWNGNDGGIIIFRASGLLDIQSGGIIAAKEIGYRGGAERVEAWPAQTGESYPGSSIFSQKPNGGGGGGGNNEGGGGGGGHSTWGEDGQGSQPGHAGHSYDQPNLLVLNLGSGGGGGMTNGIKVRGNANGASGGGAIIIFASEIIVHGSISSNGGSASYLVDHAGRPFGGGGGSGGSILFTANTANLGADLVTNLGGKGGDAGTGQGWGGDGGVGYIRLEYCNDFIGSTNPTLSFQQIACAPPPTPTNTATSTATNTPTSTNTPTPTDTPTNTPTPTDTPIPTDTPTPTPVPNQSPVAIAGTSIDINNQLELNGTLSYDSDGSIVSYSWQISGEATPRTGEIVSLANLPTGEYTVVLTVVDNYGATGSDTMLLGVPARSTSDVTGPNVVDNSPINGETDVKRNTNIQITFSELMDENTTIAAFSISPDVLGSTQWGGKKLVFIPTGKLSAYTTYTVTIGAGATDLAGNPLGNDNSFSFTTGDK